MNKLDLSRTFWTSKDKAFRYFTTRVWAMQFGHFRDCASMAKLSLTATKRSARG